MDKLYTNRQGRRYPEANVRLVIWAGHVNWTSLWKILCECVCSKVNKAPLRCEVAELSWALPALAAHFHHTHLGWAGEGMTEHPHLAAASSSSSSLNLGCKRTVPVKKVQKCCFLGGDAEIPHCEGPTVQCEGWHTQPVWKSGHLSLNTVFKHGWIFIHVAEAGLPCKCVLKVFHLPNPSCTSDNLQYYFFC